MLAEVEGAGGDLQALAQAGLHRRQLRLAHRHLLLRVEPAGELGREVEGAEPHVGGAPGLALEGEAGVLVAAGLLERLRVHGRFLPLGAVGVGGHRHGAAEGLLALPAFLLLHPLEHLDAPLEGEGVALDAEGRIAQHLVGRRPAGGVDEAALVAGVDAGGGHRHHLARALGEGAGALDGAALVPEQHRHRDDAEHDADERALDRAAEAVAEALLGDSDDTVSHVTPPSLESLADVGKTGAIVVGFLDRQRGEVYPAESKLERSGRLAVPAPTRARRRRPCVAQSAAAVSLWWSCW